MSFPCLRGLPNKPLSPCIVSRTATPTLPELRAASVPGPLACVFARRPPSSASTGASSDLRPHRKTSSRRPHFPAKHLQKGFGVSAVGFGWHRPSKDHTEATVCLQMRVTMYDWFLWSCLLLVLVSLKWHKATKPEGWVCTPQTRKPCPHKQGVRNCGRLPLFKHD